MFQHINHIFKTNKSEVLRWYHFSVRLNFQNPNLVVWCNFKGDSKHTGGSALWKSSFVILRKNSQTPLLLHRSLTPIASPELLKYPTLKMPPLIQPGATLLTLLPFPALQLSIMKKNRSSWMKSFSLSLFPTSQAFFYLFFRFQDLYHGRFRNRSDRYRIFPGRQG